MPLVSGVCRTASAPKPSHGGSRLNASKPEANPKTRCPLYIYKYLYLHYIYTKSRLALHTLRSCVVAESKRHMHRVSGKVHRLGGFATVRIRPDQPRLCAYTHAPRVLVCVCAQVFACFLYRFIFIESPPNSLELALSKAPSIFIITRQTR